jgi:hypothetical protein
MEKKTVKIHEFYPEIYPVRLWVVITKDIHSLIERFALYPSWKEISTTWEDNMLAFVNTVVDKTSQHIGCIVVFYDKKDMAIQHIAHESTHIARRIWDHLGEEATGTEADAYLVGWIAKCIDEVKNFKESNNQKPII